MTPMARCFTHEPLRSGTGTLVTHQRESWRDPDRPVADLVVCYATSMEGEGLPAMVAGRSLALLRTGVGPVNAAFALTRFLAENRARAVVACGVGGAYRGSGLDPGAVVCAETETYADLGAESPEGFLDMEALGLPVIDGEPPLFNRLPVDLFPTPRRVPFVTCATCTGTEAQAAALVARTGGAVESMEGAAVVHVARLMGVKVGEVRGISNAVGDRDRARWRVRESAAAARAALVAWIEAGGC
jgi:futalosine hydrolase